MTREVFFEFHQVGNFVKVSAIDAASGLEVSIMGPANAAPVTLRANALRKLEAQSRKQGPET